jgi:hypothetical protein
MNHQGHWLLDQNNCFLWSQLQFEVWLIDLWILFAEQVKHVSRNAYQWGIHWHSLYQFQKRSVTVILFLVFSVFDRRGHVKRSWQFAAESLFDDHWHETTERTRLLEEREMCVGVSFPAIQLTMVMIPQTPHFITFLVLSFFSYVHFLWMKNSLFNWISTVSWRTSKWEAHESLMMIMMCQEEK